ncbi:MAG: hypothetical protein V8Q54_06970 [Alistipes senegalensis]
MVFDRPLRYSVNCFLPDDEVLEEYMKEYFSEYGTQTSDDFLSLIPKNAIYHFLWAHVYGSQDLILPSELDRRPVAGVNGEQFRVCCRSLPQRDRLLERRHSTLDEQSVRTRMSSPT